MSDSRPSDMPHPASLPPQRLHKDCSIRTTRRRGPGGQHRNKVETAVVIQHTPTGIRGEASERRSQKENRAVALRRLRISLALEVRCPVSPDAAPSRLWRSRCRGGSMAINPRHEDFPALLAEALDVLAHHKMDIRAAGGQLGCSGSQLVKLLKRAPLALERVNQRRRLRELPPLR